jgi:hypothetical protein
LPWPVLGGLSYAEFPEAYWFALGQVVRSADTPATIGHPDDGSHPRDVVYPLAVTRLQMLELLIRGRIYAVTRGGGAELRERYQLQFAATSRSRALVIAQLIADEWARDRQRDAVDQRGGQVRATVVKARVRWFTLASSRVYVTETHPRLAWTEIGRVAGSAQSSRRR